MIGAEPYVLQKTRDVATAHKFLATIERLRAQPTWDKPELVALFNHMIPEFQHKDTGKYLDSRM